MLLVVDSHERGLNRVDVYVTEQVEDLPAAHRIFQQAQRREQLVRDLVCVK